MTMIIRPLAFALLGLGLAFGMAQAALLPETRPDARAEATHPAETAAPAIPSSHRPATGPKPCPAITGGTNTTCPPHAATSRGGGPVRVIPLYNTNRVAICLPDTGACPPRR